MTRDLSRERERLWQAFDELRELGEAPRNEALERLAAEDPELAAELRSLLAPPPSGFLERSPFALRLSDSTRSDKDAAEVRPPEGLIDGKYTLLERVGAGSMGFVHRAEHVQLRKLVAIKFLRPAKSASRDLSQEIAREARAVAAIRHENVVAVHDVGVYDGHAYMVMDWIEGVDLHQWLAHAASTGFFLAAPQRGALRAFIESRLPAGRGSALWSRPYCEIAAFLVARVARAIEAAHAGGIIHRDVAPKNIVVTAEGKPYLVDFGLVSLHAGKGSAELPAVAGTLPYMAPEQLAPDRKAPDPAVDTYSLGATLYHLLVGRPPFEGKGLSLYEEVRRNLPPPVRSLRPEVPRDLEAICFAAMEKRVEARYPSAAALAADLEAFLERRPVSRRPPGLAGRLVRWCQRRPARAVAVGALLLLFSVSALFLRADLRERERTGALARAERFASAFAALPALATIDADARYAAPPLSVAVEEPLGPVFDELVALRPREPLLRWYRVNWASQRGKLEQTAADLDHLRGLGLGTPLFEAVAAKLVSADPIEHNQLVEPEQLPARTSAFDYAAAGYVRMRRRDFAGAWDELTESLKLEPDQWLVRDLRALAGVDTPHADLSFEDVARVELELGRPTSRTLHVKAYLLRTTQPERAHELWTAALELGGEQHQVLHGLGELLVMHGAYDEALVFLDRATAARSGGWRTFILKSQCAAAKRDFEAAERALADGLADLQPGRPEHLFSPKDDLTLQNVNNCLAQAMYLAGTEQTDEGLRKQRQRAREVIAPLLRTSSYSPEVQRLIDATALWLDAKLGSASAEECVRRLYQHHIEYLRLTGTASPFIAVILANQLLSLGAPALDEAEALLLFAKSSSEIEVRESAEEELGRLARLRSSTGNPMEKDR